MLMHKHTTSALYEMLKEALHWFDEKYPADKYPLEPDHHYRINMNDLAIASLRENIRSVLTLAEGQQEMIGKLTLQQKQGVL